MTIGYKQYRVRYDFHTHTRFSDGKGTMEESVRAALGKGLSALAITDHGPGHLTYGIRRKEIPAMRAEIERLKRAYPEIQLFLGVEANILNGGSNLDLKREEFALFDFVIGGYHYGVRNGYFFSNFSDSALKKLIRKDRDAQNGSPKLREKNTEMVVKAVLENKLKILTHPGDKAPVDILRVASACEQTGTLFEISGWHSHPTVEELKIAGKTGVRFIVSSDAHRPERVGDCSGGIRRALEAGLEMSRLVNVETVQESRRIKTQTY